MKKNLKIPIKNLTNAILVPDGFKYDDKRIALF